MEASRVHSTRVQQTREFPQGGAPVQRQEAAGGDPEVHDIGLAAMPVLPPEPPAKALVVADPEPPPVELPPAAFEGIGPSHCPTAMFTLHGEEYGTHGNTFTEVALGQKARQDILTATQHLSGPTGPYGTPGNTLTDVATRHMGIQGLLDAAHSDGYMLASLPGASPDTRAAVHQRVIDQAHTLQEHLPPTHTFTEVAEQQSDIQTLINAGTLQGALEARKTQDAVSELVQAAHTEGYLSVSMPSDVGPMTALAIRQAAHQRVLEAARSWQGDTPPSATFTDVATRQKAIQDAINVGNLSGALQARNEVS